jgi:hypothetical protein
MASANAHDAGADVKMRLAGLLAATASGDRISAGPASAQSGQAVMGCSGLGHALG